MKKKGRAWHLWLMIALIGVFAYMAFFGIYRQYGDTTTTWIKSASDIRFGIDIRGGVDVTFMPTDGVDATEEQLSAAESVIQERLIALGVTDYETYIDANKDRIIVRFPWKEGEADFNPEQAIDEIGTTAYMTFRKGSAADGELILDGAQVASATAGYGPATTGGADEYYVALEFNPEGTTAFATATTELAGSTTPISIWKDDQNISTANVNSAITDGKAIITSNGQFTREDVITLANQINSGALPFALSAESYSTISPTLGAQSLDAMVLAGLVAFALIFVFMTLLYRLPGFIAGIALLGQTAATLAIVSGFFSVFDGFTLTLPGIAGIILAIGMGVDANVITAERIKEELAAGKTLDGAITSGFSRGLAPIIDGNVTIVIVSVVLMGAFGPTDGFFAKMLTPIFFMFGPSTAGTIYSFGCTLLAGVLLNFVFGIFCSRIMIRGASRIKALRKPWLFGAVKAKDADEMGEHNNAIVAKHDFASKRKMFTGISCTLLALVLVCSFVFGVSLDIQFKGGSMLTLSYTGEPDMNAVQSSIGEVLGNGVTYQTGENAATEANTLTVTMPGVETMTTEELDDLVNTLNENYPDNAFEQLSMSNVNATIGKEFLAKSLVAVAFAVLVILLYIAIRFKNIGGLPAGVMAVIALLNDLLLVYGSFVVLRIPLNGNFIAAMLTILGYSINDTVVMYDRIRENRGLYGSKMPFDDLVNLSINQSLRRSVNTTVTTCMALAVVCVVSVIYGLDSIFTFALPLMVGMISGLYTSLFLTTSLWMFWHGRAGAKKGSKKAKRA